MANDIEVVTITELHTDTIDLRHYKDVRLVLPLNATVKTIYGPQRLLEVLGGTLRTLGMTADHNNGVWRNPVPLAVDDGMRLVARAPEANEP